MGQIVKTEIYEEWAVLVGLITPLQKEQKAKEYMDELAFLAETAGAHPVKTFFQKVDGWTELEHIRRSR